MDTEMEQPGDILTLSTCSGSKRKIDCPGLEPVSSLPENRKSCYNRPEAMKDYANFSGQRLRHEHKDSEMLSDRL